MVRKEGDYLMKRKMLMRMLAAALSASLLAGCGNTAKPADSGSVVTAGEEEGTDAVIQHPRCSNSFLYSSN
jgi:uncharacterized lipoprotein YajG